MITILACVTAVIVALFVVPVRVAVIADPQEAPRFALRVAWLFGLVRFPVTVREEPRPEKESKPSKGSSLRAQQAVAFVRTSGAVARTRKFLGDLIRSLHPKVEKLRIELGLGDPADTGQAWAVLGPLSGWLAYRYDGRVSLDPNFAEMTMEVEGRAHLTIVPLQTVGLVVGVLASPSILRGFYEAHQAGAG